MLFCIIMATAGDKIQGGKALNYKIAFIPGDGIGPEIMKEGIRVLERIGQLFGHSFSFVEAPAGGIAIDQFGNPLPKDSLEKCKDSDAVLLAAVGGEKWDNLPVNQRPESGLLGLRRELGLFANLRPVMMYQELKNACPLKDDITGGSLDLLVVRELTGDVYFGEKGGDENYMYDVMNYNSYEVERVAHVAFKTAQGRKRKVCSVDKANVLATSKLWRNVVTRVAERYPDVQLTHMYVDNAAMQLVRDPKQFDVILTGNIFGDILSDEASMIAGSIGMLPSASLNASKHGMYEPIHGSAPDIAGKNIANPIAMILSCAMMLRHSLGRDLEADLIEKAVKLTLQSGARTADIAGGNPALGTKEMADKIIRFLQ